MIFHGDVQFPEGNLFNGHFRNLKLGVPLCSPQLLIILMIFKLEKHAKKRKTHGKSKSKTSKLKKTGSKINGKKKERQNGKNNGKKNCPFAFFLHLFRFFNLLCFCFYFACFFSMQKTKKQNKRKQCKWTNMCFSLFVFPFFPLYFAFVFLDFADLLFSFSFFFAFVALFFKF